MNKRKRIKKPVPTMDAETALGVIYVAFAILGWGVSLFATYSLEIAPLMVFVLVLGLGVVTVMSEELQTFTARILAVIGFFALLVMVFLVLAWLIVNSVTSLGVLVAFVLGLTYIRFKQK